MQPDDQRHGRSEWPTLPTRGGSTRWRLREEPFDAVNRIAGDVGPRRATSLAEAQIAAYLDGRLRRGGLRVSVDPFPAPPLIDPVGPIAAALGALSALLYYWLPLLGIGVALLASGIALWRWRSWSGRLWRHGRDSQNVIGTRAVAQVPRWRVVLIAPLDSPAVIPGPLRPLMDGERPAIGRVIACLALVVCGVAFLGDGQMFWWYGQLASACYLVAGASLEVVFALGPASPGAISHAGALAVLLSSAEELSTLRQTELWAVGMGASGSGAGLRDLLRRYPFERERTLFIGLEGLGHGALAYVTREGWLREQAADPLLLYMAAAADSADPLIDVEPRPYRGVQTIASTLQRLGWSALAVLCLGSDGQVPYRASAADTPEVVDAETLDRAVRLVVGLVQQLDADAD